MSDELTARNIAIATVAAGGLYLLWKALRGGGAMAKPSAGAKKVPGIIIAGAPGSGKGTQCEKIVEKFGVVHISTGDLLRACVKKGTPEGKEIASYIDRGALVPDELIIRMVKARLAEADVLARGWLLDGFPRTAVQARQMADSGILADVLIHIDVPDSVIVERVCGRRNDPATGTIYHLKFKPPPADDKALLARLEHRKDDTEEAVGKRLAMFHANYAAILSFYTPILVKVDGNRKMGEVTDDVLGAIGRRVPSTV